MNKLLRPRDDAARQQQLADRAKRVADLGSMTEKQRAAAEAARAERQLEEAAEDNANKRDKRDFCVLCSDLGL